MNKLYKWLFSFGLSLSLTIFTVSCNTYISNSYKGNENPGNPENPTTPEIPDTNDTSSSNYYVKWKDANPNRTTKINTKNKYNNKTYFSPYLDAGLWSGNDFSDIINSTKDTNNNNAVLSQYTLAFAQQVNGVSDKLEISFAGLKKDSSYDEWKKLQLGPKDLAPFSISKNDFKNLKISYGGYNVGVDQTQEKSPWNVALKLSKNNEENAVNILSESFKNFNEELLNDAKKYVKEAATDLETPKNIDFDIEGNSQNDKSALKVLAKTLAKMKKEDSTWNFSVTLPVLPSGLSSEGIGVLLVFATEFKNAGIDYKNMPIINLMLMDYGNDIYNQAIKDRKTNFDLAKSAIENTIAQLSKTIKNLYEINPIDDELYGLIGATPMIGINDTKAGIFTLEDAKDLYNYSMDKNIAYIGMWSQNCDRGIINGKKSIKTVTSHGLNYLNEYDFTRVFIGNWTSDILNPKDEAPEDITPNEPNYGGDDGDYGDPITPEPTSYSSWEKANPNRKTNITEKYSPNEKTYFSPYFDTGLYSGNKLEDVYKKTTSDPGDGVKKLNNLTLAFITQAQSTTDKLDLTFAGQKRGDSYDWWSNDKFYKETLSYLISNNSFENIKMSYGGFNTGENIEKNPWNVALRLNNYNINNSIEPLKNAFINFNQEWTNLASKNSGKSLKMPKNIDFDIEGKSIDDKNANILLAKTVAKMKKEDSSWNFSLTLPVLPSGLTSSGAAVMDLFIQEYKNLNISYSNLPVINLMLMDYGNPIYRKAIKDGKTNFDLSIEAINNTSKRLSTSIQNIYNYSVDYNNLYYLIGATPMIGINDTAAGIFTLEDAKELYNWSQKNNLAYTSMWSLNDDKRRDNNNDAKSVTSHGLTYLNDCDFTKVFIGNWDNQVKKPNTSL
ncbi:hypothetical protein [Spiroplasma turonicum]|uniref:Bifunctional chitinase/lysozyme n=1 Tax=Spiroplasma turonicum TaxID=216946 RepID=A0A0K1P6G1_9MOLU|nr:hypothetical protein [Spiroplasma turonicum]AKU79789.1 hypothetical protein STURON_00543 [Spiroplasma turonicum]ALX70807.1 bifunctional chitinase/lysozyme [Spiroplasma turonicum]